MARLMFLTSNLLLPSTVYILLRCLTRGRVEVDQFKLKVSPTEVISIMSFRVLLPKSRELSAGWSASLIVMYYRSRGGGNQVVSMSKVVGRRSAVTQRR